MMLLVLLFSALAGYIDVIAMPVRLPFSINVALSTVVFYGLGYSLKDFLLNSNYGIVVALVCLFVAIVVGLANQKIDMSHRVYGNPMFFYAASLLSIYALICFFKRIPSNKLVSYIGENSLSFFLLQEVGFSVVNICAYLILRATPNSMGPNLIYAVCYVSLSLLVLFPVVYMINSKIPIITGRSRGKWRRGPALMAQGAS
jgi:fucose 4-O-acetylase-like acetyltransferase